MTDNEKAATFIEWKPDTLCKNTHAWNWWCETCNWYPKWPEQFHEHAVPAPNMADAARYTKALENLAKVRTLTPEITIPIMDSQHWRATIYGTTPLISFIHSEIGPAVVAALAALYDAEHAGGKENHG